MRSLYVLSISFFIIMFSNCSKTYKVKTDQDTVQVFNQYVGEQYNITVIKKDVKIITDFDKTSQSPYGRRIYLDSNNIPRKIEWYHKNDKPFYTFEYLNLFYYGERKYSNAYLDTSLITTPEVKSYKQDGHLYLEVFSKNYPSNLIDFEIFNTDSIDQFKRVITTNTCYFDIIFNEDIKYIDITYRFYNENDKMIKLIERVKVKI